MQRLLRFALLAMVLLCGTIPAQVAATTNARESIQVAEVVTIDDARSVVYTASGHVLLLTKWSNGHRMVWAENTAQVLAFAQIPQPTGGEATFTAEWTDGDGTTHIVTTPVPSGGGPKALREHLALVKAYQDAFPPVKPE